MARSDLARGPAGRSRPAASTFDGHVRRVRTARPGTRRPVLAESAVAPSPTRSRVQRPLGDAQRLAASRPRRVERGQCGGSRRPPLDHPAGSGTTHCSCRSTVRASVTPSCPARVPVPQRDPGVAVDDEAADTLLGAALTGSVTAMTGAQYRTGPRPGSRAAPRPGRSVSSVHGPGFHGRGVGARLGLGQRVGSRSPSACDRRAGRRRSSSSKPDSSSSGTVPSLFSSRLHPARTDAQTRATSFLDHDHGRDRVVGSAPPDASGRRDRVLQLVDQRVERARG